LRRQRSRPPASSNRARPRSGGSTPSSIPALARAYGPRPRASPRRCSSAAQTSSTEAHSARRPRRTTGSRVSTTGSRWPTSARRNQPQAAGPPASAAERVARSSVASDQSSGPIRTATCSGPTSGIRPELDAIAGDDFYADFSSERIDLLDTDVLLWFIDREEIAGEGFYRRLAVAREGRDVFLGGESDLTGAFSFNSVLSLPFLLDELPPRVAAAIDGDPSTVPAPARG
jgi:hypothetical protein